MRHYAAVLTASLCACLVATANATILCVNPGGTGGCLASIQDAIDASAAGDKIEVAAGTYAGNLSIPSDRKQFISGAGAAATTINGGIAVNYPGYLDLSGVTVEGPGSSGDGIIADNETGVFITDCVIKGFSIGIHAEEPYRVVLTNTTVGPNANNGVFMVGDPGDTPPRLTLSRSTIRDNGRWGIIIDTGSVIVLVQDSTISGSGTAAFESTGFGATGRPRLWIRRSTIAANARGIVDSTPAPARLNVRLDGSIVADSTAGPDILAPNARVRSSSTNVIESLDPSTVLRGKGNDLLGWDPSLGPLQNNGGPTATHALLAGSQAIDFITRDARCRLPDQRGVARSPAPCDAGAYATP